MILNVDVLENKEVLEIDLEGDLWKVEFKKPKIIRMKKSKPMGSMGWIILGIIIILLLASN